MPKRKMKSAKAVPGDVVEDLKDWRSEPRALRAFEGDWKVLADAAGGVQGLARLLGVSYPTLYRWAVKREPMAKASRFLVANAAVRLGVEPPPMTRREGEVG